MHAAHRWAEGGTDVSDETLWLHVGETCVQCGEALTPQDRVFRVVPGEDSDGDGYLHVTCLRAHLGALMEDLADDDC